jgi:cytochrome c-type biogenesis protein CcmE
LLPKTDPSQPRHGPARVTVRYDAPLPDGIWFRPPDRCGAEVLLTGSLGKDGIFQARRVITKCPSKYEARPAGEPPPSHCPGET